MCQYHLNVQMGFTNEQFPAGTHMCMIYNSEEERKKIISEYLGAGISSQERVAYFADEATPDQILEWLSELGVQNAAADELENFSVSTTAETYYHGNCFVPDKMLNKLKDFYNASKEDNYSACRVTGEMSWALKGVPGSDQLMVYEAKVNDVVAEYPVTAICQYDANKFDGATILD